MSEKRVTHEAALEVVRAIPAGDTLWRERVQLLWRYVRQQEAADQPAPTETAAQQSQQLRHRDDDAADA